MLMLIAGLIVFLGCHCIPMFPDRRAGLQDKFGVNGYRVVFSLVSAAGLALIIYGYGQAWDEGPVFIYEPPYWLRHVTMLFMVPVFIFLVAAYVPCRIKRALKHPMLVAVKLWAFSHLLVNGDLASVLLFGSFLVWAVADRVSVKRRAGAGGADADTDTQPGRYSDIAVILVGLALYGLFVWKLHVLLIGVPVG